jgi:hypothetical protein
VSSSELLRRAGANGQIAIEKLTALTLELRRHPLEPRHLLLEPLLLTQPRLAQHVRTKFAALEAESQLRKLR